MLVNSLMLSMGGGHNADIVEAERHQGCNTFQI